MIDYYKFIIFFASNYPCRMFIDAKLGYPPSVLDALKSLKPALIT